LVSAAMITYNHAPYIAQAIEGVLQQKVNFPFELVIGEDCSTDGTREIVLEYQKKYPDIIRAITSDKNVGMKKNGYRTLKACRGKYIAFCEGDDYWHHPYKLQKQADYLEGHPECGMVFTDFNVYFDGSNELIRSFNSYKGFHSPANITIEQIIGGEEGPTKMTCTVMIRRDLYKQIIESDPYLHQSGTFLMGDYQVWAEAALISEVSYLPESLGTYRVLDESASRTRDIRKSLRFWRSASDMMFYLCDKHQLTESIRRQVESDWCDRSLRLAFHERNADLALEVKKKKQRFTWKEWIRYYGARNLAFHYVYRVAAFFRNLFREKDHELAREFEYAPRELSHAQRDSRPVRRAGAGRHG
jgi:glycosyltransferase involved in cell wall biosynthesis